MTLDEEKRNYGDPKGDERKSEPSRPTTELAYLSIKLQVVS